jgi:hypothetical protein
LQVVGGTCTGNSRTYNCYALAQFQFIIISLETSKDCKCSVFEIDINVTRRNSGK